MLVAGWKSTSSNASWPTSPIQRSPVARSKLKRHGLRRPYAQISPRAPARVRERIRRRDRVRRAVIDVDAQDLAEELIEVLGVVVRIAAGAAVAGADVEKAVRAELELAAVVVGERRDAGIVSRIVPEAASARSGSDVDTL